MAGRLGWLAWHAGHPQVPPNTHADARCRRRRLPVGAVPTLRLLLPLVATCDRSSLLQSSRSRNAPHGWLPSAPHSARAVGLDGLVRCVRSRAPAPVGRSGFPACIALHAGFGCRCRRRSNVRKSRLGWPAVDRSATATYLPLTGDNTDTQWFILCVCRVGISTTTKYQLCIGIITPLIVL